MADRCTEAAYEEVTHEGMEAVRGRRIRSRQETKALYFANEAPSLSSRTSADNLSSLRSYDSKNRNAVQELLKKNQLRFLFDQNIDEEEP